MLRKWDVLELDFAVLVADEGVLGRGFLASGDGLE